MSLSFILLSLNLIVSSWFPLTTWKGEAHDIPGWHLGKAIGLGDGLFTRESVVLLPASDEFLTSFFYSLYQDVFFAPCRSWLINPVRVDLYSLTSTLIGSTPCAAVRTTPAETELAQFMMIGMVAESSLQKLLAHPRNLKMIRLLLPTVALDHFQACVSIAFDKWDAEIRSQIDTSGIEFTTRSMLSLRFLCGVRILMLMIFRGVREPGREPIACGRCH